MLQHLEALRDVRTVVVETDEELVARVGEHAGGGDLVREAIRLLRCARCHRGSRRCRQRWRHTVADQRRPTKRYVVSTCTPGIGMPHVALSPPACLYEQNIARSSPIVTGTHMLSIHNPGYVGVDRSCSGSVLSRT